MRFEVLQRRNERSGKFQWYWQLTSSNGAVLIESAGGYDDVRTCYADLRRRKGSSSYTVENLVTGESVLVLTE